VPTSTRAVLLVIVSLSVLRAASGAAAPSGTSGDRPSAKTTASPSAAHTALAAGDAQGVLDLLDRHTLGLSGAERKSLQGRAHFLQGHYGIARRKLLSALRSRSERDIDHYWLGRVYLATDAPALAAAAFEKAHWFGLETADLRHYWATALAKSGLVTGEISRKPWSTEKSPPPALGEFALGGLIVGHIPKRKGCVVVAPSGSALYQVYRALQADADRADSRLLAGELWAAAKQHAQAIKLFEQAQGGLRGDALARCHHAWAESALRLGDHDGYLRHARKEMEASGGVDSTALAACYDRAAREAAGRGDLPRQVRYLMFAVELRSEVDRLLRLADALMASKRTADARRYLQTALDQGPSPSQRRAISMRMRNTMNVSSVKPD